MIPNNTRIEILPVLAVEQMALGTDQSPDQPFAIISIMTAATQAVRLPKSDKCLGVLRLNFPDFVKPISGWEHAELFSPRMANQAWDFVETLPAPEILLIHCEAGVSRSAAIGAAIAKVLGQDFEMYFEKFYPNPLVYRIMLEEWNRRHNVSEPVVVPPKTFPEGLAAEDIF